MKSHRCQTTRTSRVTCLIVMKADMKKTTGVLESAASSLTYLQMKMSQHLLSAQMISAMTLLFTSLKKLGMLKDLLKT